METMFKNDKIKLVLLNQTPILTIPDICTNLHKCDVEVTVCILSDVVVQSHETVWRAMFNNGKRFLSQ